MGGVAGGGEGAEEADGGAVKGGVFAANGGIGEVFAVFGGGFEGFDDFGLGPCVALAHVGGIEFGGFEGLVVGAEMADGGGVKAGVFLLQSAAVERFVALRAGFEFHDNGVAVPLAVAGDVVGVEAGGLEGAVPAAEEAGLEGGESGLAEFVAALGNGGPVEVLALALGVFYEFDDGLLGPTRSADNFGVIDAGFFDGFAIGAEMVCGCREQGLHRSAEGVVRQILFGLVELLEFLEDAIFVPNHDAPRLRFA